MKLLICTGIFPPEVGGPATYSQTLAEELVKRGHEVKVVTYADARDSSQAAPHPTLSPKGRGEEGEKGSEQRDPLLRVSGGEEELRVIRVTRSHNKLSHYFRYLLAVLWHGRKSDILYAQDPVSAGLPTWLASKILRKPFALKITGDYSWERAVNLKLTDKLIDDFQNKQDLPEQIKTIRQTQIRVSKAADVIITPAHYLKRLVVNWGVTRPIEVIYNAAPKVGDLDKSIARQKLGITESEFMILSAGRNVPWKGFAVLNEAVMGLKSKFSDLTLNILHDAPREKLMQYLKAADVFVLNTAYEGSPHILLEAMQLGAPVVTTKVCGNPEFVEDGETGLLVDYNNKEQIKDAILRLYQYPDLRMKLAENAREAVKKYSPDKMISQTEKILSNYITEN